MGVHRYGAVVSIAVAELARGGGILAPRSALGLVVSIAMTINI